MQWYSVCLIHFLLTLLLSPFPKTFMAVTFLLFDLSCQLLRHCGTHPDASSLLQAQACGRAHRKLTQTGRIPSSIKRI